MAKVKTVFICTGCGAQSPKWIGKCNSCGEWNTYQEEVVTTPGASRNKGNWHQKTETKVSEKPKLLQDIKTGSYKRIPTNDVEFDRVLGGGIVPGSVILLGGHPGIGKSTLALQSAINMDVKVLYVSGEESEEQIRMRADRINGLSGQCYIYGETDLVTILRQAESLEPKLIVLDSIQTMFLDHLESSAGSISQIREVAAELQRYAKENNVAIIIIGHITKDGDLAGPKLLEHIVDTVLYFEGDRHYAYRLLRSRKNRFGSTDEIGIYEMMEGGLKTVSNPSDALSGLGNNEYSGNALGIVGEGSRTFVIEVQALVTRAVYGTPQRSSTGYDLRRMNMLLAVLEKKCQLPLGFNDVFLNVAGGIRVDDPSIDLALAAAIISSLQNVVVPRGMIFIGEVGLSGEVRPVQKIEQKLMEAERMGIDTAFISKYSKLLPNTSRNIKIISLIKVEELLEVFS
ncbi:MAG: DNA repair protein RadA [Saprospiraceae bacterium]|nr:DNA repair protein RadA [Saprospiraceae bacterium]MCA0333083.1 DNA repair protein RadA [Bacteroidota bacterium]HMT76834.1 DNA repair protein RadA [Saprospiraceae bacterium]HQU94855.1 DNA repair protein RadA [Saprospiraceae bacterium]